MTWKLRWWPRPEDLHNHAIALAVLALRERVRALHHRVERPGLK
ncbi:hypothetical protein ACLEPN_16535 [Myxococcus sp. 1LA]